MSFALDYDEAVKKSDIPKLDQTMRERVKRAIFVKLIESPEHFGLHLRDELKGYLKLRVGDYRVIFAIRGDRVKIFAIQHRSVVYRSALKRLGL